MKSVFKRLILPRNDLHACTNHWYFMPKYFYYGWSKKVEKRGYAVNQCPWNISVTVHCHLKLIFGPSQAAFYTNQAFYTKPTVLDFRTASMWQTPVLNSVEFFASILSELVTYFAIFDAVKNAVKISIKPNPSNITFTVFHVSRFISKSLPIKYACPRKIIFSK